MSKLTIILLLIIGIIIYRNFKVAQREARRKMESQKQSQNSKPKGEMLYESGETKVFKGDAGKKE